MKKIYTLFIFISSLTVAAQTGPGPDLATPLNKAMDIRYDNGTLTALTQLLNGVLTDNSKQIVSRDNKGTILLNEVYYKSPNWTIMTRDKSIPTYDGSGRLSTLWSRSFSGDTAHFRVSWTYQIGYNGSGLPVYYNRADSFYDGTTLTQTTIQVDSVSYNGAGKVSSIRTFTKNQTTGIYMVPANFTSWVDYDVNNNPIAQTQALTAYGDSAIMYRMKIGWDAQNRMISVRSFPSYNYLQYKDSVYEQKSQYFSYNGSGELSLVVDSQYSGFGLQPYATYRSFIFTGGKLMSMVQDMPQNSYADSAVYHRNGTGLPDSISHFLNMGTGYAYRGRIVYTYGPNAPMSVVQVNSTTMLVYPNPIRNVFTIEGEAEGSYKLLNLQGDEVKAGIFSEGKNEIHVDELRPGMYLLMSETKGQRSTQKILIQ